VKSQLIAIVAAVVLVGCVSESLGVSQAYYIAHQTGFGVLHGST
jgi:hypothetical protein